MDGAERAAEDPVGEQLRFLNVVGLAMVASVAVYAVVAWFLTDGDAAIAGPDLPSELAWVGAAVAIGLLIAAPIVHRKTIEGATRSLRPEEGAVTKLESYRLATLLAFLLRDGAAIVGLMLAIVTGQPYWCYGLGAVTVVAMFAGWPRREDLDEALAHGAG